MREFALIDGNGEEYSLTVEDSFLHDPSGLGFEHDNTYRQVGTRFIKANTSSNQSVISGKVHFHPSDAYEEYQKFVEFSGRDGLKLKYKLAEIPARSVDIESEVLDVEQIKSDGIYEGTYDCINGSYSFSHVLIQCDGTEDIRYISTTTETVTPDSVVTTTEDTCFYGIRGLTYPRDTTEITYCNGLPALNYSDIDYLESYGNGTLTGGLSNEILIALSKEALHGKTINQWLAENKPQFCYKVANNIIGNNSAYIFDPKIKYNPRLEAYKIKDSGKEDMVINVSYHDKDNNLVELSGSKLNLNNTEYDQHLDSLLVNVNIDNKRTNNYFKGTSFLITSFDDIEWSPGNEHYYFKPDQFNCLSGLRYGKRYKINGKFLSAPQGSYFDKTPMGKFDESSFGTCDIKFQVGTNSNIGMLDNTEWQKVKMRLTVVMQDKPSKIHTNNMIELFSFTGSLWSSMASVENNSVIYNGVSMSAYSNHGFWLYRRYYPYSGDTGWTYVRTVSCYFNENVDKEFIFNSDNDETYDLYFGVYLEILENPLAPNSQQRYLIMNQYSNVQPFVKSALRCIQVDPSITNVSHEANTLGLYLLDMAPTSTRMPPWTEDYYNTILNSYAEQSNHYFRKALSISDEYNPDYLNSNHVHNGQYYDSNPMIIVYSNGTIKKEPYYPDVVEDVNNMYLDSSPIEIKEYDSESQNYYREVEIKSVEKTELDKTESLESKVSFECLEPWINRVTSLVEHDEDDANYMIVDSDSHTLSPCTLFIEGPVSNPEWKQYVDGNEIAAGKYIGDVSDGETLVIHSKPGENKIYLLSNNTSTDVYQNSDFSTARFMYIRYGNNKFVVNNYQYVETEDESFEEGKTYYELTSTNPDVYTVTSDVSMVSGKTYYEYVNVELDCRIEGELYYESV